MKRFSYIDLNTTDPAWNLATEQYIFDSLPQDRSYLMLWQNDNAIIIGKHQNTLSEINEQYVRANGIRVVRRLSGGGAVYHDLGNLNYTFITDAGDEETLDLHMFCLPIVRTLTALGVNAEVNGRNDITLNGKKFSGNSQYVKNGRVMHHGTIMFDSDLNVVASALQVDESKFQSKAVKSVRSRVTNLRPFFPAQTSLQDFRAALLKSLLLEMPGEEYQFSEKDKIAIERLQKERYSTYEWNYGRSPAFTMRKAQRIEGCGTVEAYFEIEHGLIKSLVFRGDFFSASEPDEFAAFFIGQRPEAKTYTRILAGTDVSRYFSGMTRDNFLRLMTD